jgi:hypothetical protein
LSPFSKKCPAVIHITTKTDEAARTIAEEEKIIIPEGAEALAVDVMTGMDEEDTIAEVIPVVVEEEDHHLLSIHVTTVAEDITVVDAIHLLQEETPGMIATTTKCLYWMFCRYPNGPENFRIGMFLLQAMNI